MVASTFYSEVKRLYVSLQESVGVRRKKQAVVIVSCPVPSRY
jgi:hypothetical protein